jgi:hypothetical protein
MSWRQINGVTHVQIAGRQKDKAERKLRKVEAMADVGHGDAMNGLRPPGSQ